MLPRGIKELDEDILRSEIEKRKVKLPLLYALSKTAHGRKVNFANAAKMLLTFHWKTLDEMLGALELLTTQEQLDWIDEAHNELWDTDK